MDIRRRMLMGAAGKKWATEPLEIYNVGTGYSPKTSLTNGTISKNGARYVTIGSVNFDNAVRAKGIVVSSGGRFSISGIDVTDYRKLVATYTCGTTDGYVTVQTNTKFGWGYSASSSLVSFATYQTPKAYSSNGTLEFDLTSVDGQIYIGGINNDDGCFIAFTDIHLE